MRVMVVNTTDSGGGAARMASLLHGELSNTPGVESHFAVGRRRRRESPGVKKLSSVAESGLHLVLTRLTGMQGYGTPLATRRLVRLVQGWRPDVVHVHNVHGYYLDLDWVVRLRDGGWYGPIVWTLHDTWALTGRCAYFMECDRWLRGCGRCPDLKRYPRTFFDTSGLMWKKKRAAFTTDRGLSLVCPSRWLASAARRSFLGDLEVKVIPNGVDTEEFVSTNGEGFRRRHGIPQEHCIVLFAAKDLDVERKGGRLACRVMAEIGQGNVTVVSIGRTAQRLPEGPNFRHLGMIEEPGVVGEVFGAADLFCILSLEENFPTTVLEALASGTPVVGFAVGGVGEQVTSECGRLFEPPRIDAVVEAVRRLESDRALLHEMAQNARERAVEQYSIQTFVRRHVDLYRSLWLYGRGSPSG